MNALAYTNLSVSICFYFIFALAHSELNFMLILLTLSQVFKKDTILFTKFDAQATNSFFHSVSALLKFYYNMQVVY